MTDPVSHFEEIAATHDRCFWLDGGGSRPWSGHRSILGWLDPDDVSLTYDAGTGEVVRHEAGSTEVVGDDIFAALEEVSADPSEQGAHWVGYFGYASRPDLPAAVDPEDPMPTAVWMRTHNVRIFEHDPDRAVEEPPGPLVEEPPGPPVEEPPGPPVEEPPGPPVEDGALRLSRDPAVPDRYATEFDRVQEQLRAGNSYEVNLTHRRTIESDLDPVAAYLRLRGLNPAPYAGFLRHRGAWLLSSSPERFATIDGRRRIETKPIKGTTPRGRTPAEDRRLRDLLATDPKFRGENLMIVDLLRNDLGMVCEPGTVEVPVLMDVESYTSVHQLVSTVRGRLRDDVSTVEALRALFPAGSMTGAPKLRTMEIIRDVEATARGVYAGAFGWLSGGRADLGVVIRSLTTAGDGRWRLGTGGGITVRSEVEEEYAESRWKAERLAQVFD